MLLESLRDPEVLAKHPDLADFFRKNPNPVMTGSAGGAMFGSPPLPGIADPNSFDALRERTTAFYYLAHRFIKACKELPQLRFKCMPITIVRNHLLEHADKAGITAHSFGYTTEKGPIVQGLRRTSEAHIYPDEGFFANSKAFLDNLKSALDRALR